MKLLLVTAPMIQINTPYPATAYLKGFLQSQIAKQSLPEDFSVQQADPAILLVHKLFSETYLKKLAQLQNKLLKPFQKNFDKYVKGSKIAVNFDLNNIDKATLKKILNRKTLPEGSRFAHLNAPGPLLDAFESLQQEDQALHLRSLFLDDLADYFQLADEHFAFARYGEKLAASQISFDPLYKVLKGHPSIVSEALEEVIEEIIEKEKPKFIGISAPFSGTVYAALLIGAIAKKHKIPVILGGGYPNTELRELSDPRVFEFVDFITLDDGERPLLCLLEYFQGTRSKAKLCRTFFLEDNKVCFVKGTEKDIPFPETGCPDYSGLPLDKYLAMYEMINPVTKLWTGYFWNKLTLAHGCYWHRCTFCDTKLDYIGRYEADKAKNIVDKMISISEQTGSNGFHFVDEAAPPALLKALAKELIERKCQFVWWGNIRFDKAFTADTCDLLKQAGCIAVTGGLEVASDRILKLIDKGVTVPQVARVAKNFQESGIFVHAYLMYGFPTQTEQETVDSLEVVRQLFEENCLHSAFWHRFAATAHSPVGHDPKAFNITIEKPATPPQGIFSINDLPFHDPKGANHDSLGDGLKKALYNFMHGNCLEIRAHEWFEGVPKTKIPAKYIRNSL